MIIIFQNYLIVVKGGCFLRYLCASEMKCSAFEQENIQKLPSNARNNEKRK